MLADFDSEMRKREHEFNLRLDEMRNIVLSHELKVKSDETRNTRSVLQKVSFFWMIAENVLNRCSS